MNEVRRSPAGIDQPSLEDLPRSGEPPSAVPGYGQPAPPEQGVRILKSSEGGGEVPGQSSFRLPPGDGLMRMDPAILISIVNDVLVKLDEKQMATFASQLERAQPKYEKILDSRLQTIETQYQKQKEAKETERKNQIAADVQLGLGVAMTIFGIIASILSAGALSGLMVAGLAVGAAMTTLDVVNRGLKAGEVKYDDPLDKTGSKKNQLDISIGGLVKMAVEQSAANNTFFYPPEVAKGGKEAMDKYRNEVIMGVTIFLSIAIAAGSIALSAGGIAALKNAAKAGNDAASVAKDTASTASKFTKFAEAHSSSIQLITQTSDVAADIINLSASIYQGANTIVMADTTFDMKMAEAQANRLGAYADSERTHIERIHTAMRNSSESFSQTRQILADSRSMLSETKSNLINMS
jgi:hypothetical protein